MPQFNGLNGFELKAVILDHIDKALTATGEFPQGLAFPWVKFDFSVKVTSYPKRPMEAEPEEVVKGSVVLGEEQPEGEVIQVEVTPTTSIVIETPDKAREDAGLAIPVAAPGLGGVIVDKPVMRKQGK